MSYELCVFKPDYVTVREAASDVWNNEKYRETSAIDQDRSAVKWRVKDMLIGVDDQLTWQEPEIPRTGFLAKLFFKPAPVQRHLHVALVDDYGETSFDIFDQAIEINLPWDSPRAEVEKHVRNLWRYLERLSASGWSTIYDTERDELLNLEADFEAVLARYLENLGPDEVEGGEENTQKEPRATPASNPASAPAVKGEKPFTGNVD